MLIWSGMTNERLAHETLQHAEIIVEALASNVHYVFRFRHNCFNESWWVRRLRCAVLKTIVPTLACFHWRSSKIVWYNLMRPILVQPLTTKPMRNCLMARFKDRDAEPEPKLLILGRISVGNMLPELFTIPISMALVSPIASSFALVFRWSHSSHKKVRHGMLILQCSRARSIGNPGYVSAGQVWVGLAAALCNSCLRHRLYTRRLRLRKIDMPAHPLKDGRPSPANSNL